jgi:hypothetical protein
LELFIRKFQIPRYISKNNKEIGTGLEPDVEMFFEWARGFWDTLSEKDRLAVPQETLEYLRSTEMG